MARVYGIDPATGKQFPVKGIDVYSRKEYGEIMLESSSNKIDIPVKSKKNIVSISCISDSLDKLPSNQIVIYVSNNDFCTYSYITDDVNNKIASSCIVGGDAMPGDPGGISLFTDSKISLQVSVNGETDCFCAGVKYKWEAW